MFDKFLCEECHKPIISNFKKRSCFDKTKYHLKCFKNLLIKQEKIETAKMVLLTFD